MRALKRYASGSPSGTTGFCSSIAATDGSKTFFHVFVGKHCCFRGLLDRGDETRSAAARIKKGSCGIQMGDPKAV